MHDIIKFLEFYILLYYYYNNYYYYYVDPPFHPLTYIVAFLFSSHPILIFIARLRFFLLDHSSSLVGPWIVCWVA
uniref:Uncharacterized protein n=1 Tax=Vitis vinifera TaxID=29760 RepID=F6HRN2_VITVI